MDLNHAITGLPLRRSTVIDTMPTKTEWVVAIVLPLHVTLLAWYMLSSSESDNITPSYLKLWCFYFVLDATYSHLFHTLLLVPVRWIARHLPGALVPSSDQEKELVEQEESSNDKSLEWPSADAIAKLPSDWVVSMHTPDKEEKIAGDGDKGSNNAPKSIKKKRSKSKNNKPKSSQQCNNTLSDQKLPAATKKIAQQPYYLNHVRGSTRIRQASQRIGAAMGSILASYMICHLSASKITLEDVGLTLPSLYILVVQDLAWGFSIGSSIVSIIFITEVWLGWIKIVGFFQTVVPNESFAINFLWDVLFHAGVSINEEVMLRGWMFTLGCRGILAMALDWFEDSSNAATFSIIASIILQSSLFSFLHLHSPGSTYVSLLNLFLGGIAASINVMVAGGSLWLGIGWHFGWNIFMGHILGRSTSGIPMSCACTDVIPRPKSSHKKCFESYHGGTFGPEQGVLAPLAYVIGIILVICVCGFDEMIVWRDGLVSSHTDSP
eukprot:scaffold4346_cov155-Skeletonema_dohrnii-CCMP3373.AAC.1